ncbi:MAG: hypothetical protein A3E31_18020 [Candidatus Rokubacteria bacterium RIFCSPHIGHO2_12_FULL_73_22]|nr:MAG: hypothetical protein A3E31_18020 [Candidatus Rokubacteria bacterium RIFCSPHIGHO2_12_FULL_73_22]
MRRTLAIAATLLLAAAPAAAQGPRPDPKPRPGAPAAAGQASGHKNETVAFAKFPGHGEILARVGRDGSAFTFAIRAVDKQYKDDVWVGAGPARARVSCVRFKSTSGFSLKVEPPQFSVSGDTLTIDQRIPSLSVTGLHATFQLGPCVQHSVTFGIAASNVHFQYKARPALSFDGGGRCKFSLNPTTQKINVKIGGFNAKPLQNDLDKLVKKWLERSLEESLNLLYPLQVGNGFVKASLGVCGT